MYHRGQLLKPIKLAYQALRKINNTRILITCQLGFGWYVNQLDRVEVVYKLSAETYLKVLFQGLGYIF